MLTGMAVSASALMAVGQRHRVSANNVANILTPGFRAARVEFESVPGGGVRVGAVRESPAPGEAPAQTGAAAGAGRGGEADDAVGFPRGEMVFNPALAGAEAMALSPSNVDPLVEAVNGIVNRIAFVANAAAFRAQDQATAPLLDLVT
ncbi:MAG: hypothetical protein HY719_12905 [Planctomycetes bacterium]|nr:hypothetical protein [Planctomycetota bacterium]